MLLCSFCLTVRRIVCNCGGNAYAQEREPVKLKFVWSRERGNVDWMKLKEITLQASKLIPLFLNLLRSKQLSNQ